MADTFQLELVSPERLLLSRQVEMVTIPAIEGEMGVLPGHSPMIVALRGGVIRVRENGAETERLFVAGGFAEVLPDRCTVLADEATPLANLSRAEAERRLAEAEAAMANVTAEDSPERRDAALNRVLSMRAMRDAAEAA
ncbi:MAG: F0F1 ATP synthase subunit epsilon [Acetobacteraceae bacterium]|nr:F0F1 ATP synthase subunit epsilon [Acetobacteraceae bacterium]MDI3308636.1 F0F1 ATP synthase subunit epsilon [Acetobacteraceae bacterium]